MVVYVALVAIINLLLGMFLARVFPLPQMWPLHSSADSFDDDSAPEAAPAAVDGASDPRKHQADAGEVLNSEQQSPVTPIADTRPQTARTSSREAAFRTWDDFAGQLRDVKDRTHYCRTARDRQLVRQAAEQLRTCARVWYSELEACLLGDALNDATQVLIAGADTSAIEMFAAQIETTLTNLDSLELDASIDDVLNSLEREIGMLDQQQRNVAASRTKI